MAVKKYLVPVDFSKSSRAALRYAARLAKNDRGASLMVLHVITESAGRVPFYLRKKFHAELASSARKRMDALVRNKRLDLPKHKVAIVKGSDAAETIAKQAHRWRASMIVMGSRGRTGFKRFVLGSVAERTLRYARCPVLIVKA